MRLEIFNLKEKFREEKYFLLSKIKKILAKGNLVLTPELENFEKKFAKYVGKKFCLGLNSGTDALLMALWSLGIKKGDEVITSSISFIATVNSIIHVGAKPVLVDVKNDLNLNEDLIENKITKKTKAIIPVHWTGRICNMDKLSFISKKYNIPIIEDAAQAAGSYYKNKHGGSFGLISCFSAHPLKNLNALGDGGLILTDNLKIYKKIKKYRNHGLINRDESEFVGVNSRLDTINAEVLSFRLDKIKSIVKLRSNNVKYLRSLIKSNEIKIINEKKNQIDSNVMFIVLCKNRDKLQKYLAKHGVQSLIYYKYPLHFHKTMKKFGYRRGQYPVSENLCKQVLALPIHEHLSKKQLNFMAERINKFYEKKN